MKGKILSFKILFAMLILFASAFCFGVGILPETQSFETVSAASTKVEIDGNEYSALFKGNHSDSTDDVIFSVEKVLVDSSYGPSIYGLEKFAGTEKGTGAEKDIYFKNIRSSASQSKTVVDNGDFVILNNELTGTLLHAPDESNAQEALIVSFGSYVYKNGDVSIAEGTTNYSPISFLSVSLEINGTVVNSADMPDYRNISVDEGGLFFDFVQVINQQDNDSNEGYYKYTIRYYINFKEYTETFEFYVLNNISYTRSYNIAKGYKANPTLGWTGDAAFEKSNKVNGYVRYKVGESGIDTLGKKVSYPTITYDYTKYSLSIKHTANQNNTIYTFSREFRSTLSTKSAVLNYQINKSGKIYSDSKKMEEYDKDSNINLVTIMLTEPGSYVVSYDFIYDGYNSNNAPKIGSTQEIKFAIHGLEANYSKTDYESADLQYLEISTEAENHVDLFVVGGYSIDEDISKLKGSELGFVYKLVENDNREGDVVYSSSKDALINGTLKDGKTYGFIDSTFEYLVRSSGLVTKDASLITAANISTFKSILDNIQYVQTNQGSIWLSGNDTYTTNSVYWYSPTKITAEDLYTITRAADNSITDVVRKTGAADIEENYTNTTTFNKKGYYLVFIEIDKNGMEEGDKFWQIFAFQYTSSSVDINIDAIIDDKGTDSILDDETQVIAGGKYTNKNVRISWKKPGLFDRAIYGYYYSVVNNNSSRDQLLSTTKKTLDAIEFENKIVVELGQEVQKNTFVKYLIRLESEGEGATHKIFTIDRQSISGVQPFLIEELYSGNHVYYAFSTDKYNNTVPINNSITNGFATISWNDKASGAETYASYNFTPFVQIVQNSDTVKAITGVGGKTWISTNYELGTTLEGYSFEKAESIYSVSSANILSNQGIYIIKIWDDAGNETYYSFVIDRTESYFQIGDKLAVNSYQLFGDDVDYSLGESKVFELKTTNEELNSYLQKASENKLSEFKDGAYYSGTYNNISTISNYFQSVSGKTYLTVKNQKVVAYDTTKTEDTKITSTQGTLYYQVNRGESYFKRTLYVIGENHTEFAQNIKTITYERLKQHPYIVVEINKDNSLGMVYYSTSKIEAFPEGGDSTGSVIRLDHGSDTIDFAGNIESGIYGAGATSASHVSFIWNMGTGKFEVAKVSYTYYVLDPLVYNATDGDMYYFYSSKDDPVIVYNNGWIQGGPVSNGRGAFSINGNNEVRPGLYVVKREYKNESGNIDFGEDSEVKNYYFIVDRNQVIDVSQGIGSNIKIELLEGDADYGAEFNSFSIGGTDYEVFSNSEDSIYNQRYNIYLNTTKLPATLNVPTGKYLDGLYTSAEYNAGRLNVTVYFNDIYGQLEGKYQNGTIKIFDSYNLKDKDVYNIDIYKYLTNENISLRNRLTESDKNGDWLFLSGDYIIRVTDNVVDTLGKTHEKYIGLRIKGISDAGPKVDAYTAFDKETPLKVSINPDAKFIYSGTVSQEFLKVEIPAYIDGETEKAQIDPDYFVAMQYYGEGAKGIAYINHPNKQLGGYLYKDYANGVVENNDGKISVWLDTKLRKANGELDLENLTKPLYYTITVRYKIGNAANPTKYENCYIYYDPNSKEPVAFYEATYTIRIDREAPSSNIDYLNSQDALVQDYNNEFGTKEMMTNGVHETTSNLYFTKQYNKYYASNMESNKYIYPYQVNAATLFNTSDIKYIYHSTTAITDLSTYKLTLPLINESLYTRINPIENGIKNYSGLKITESGYYEIIEQDAAGNMTQYIIHYLPSMGTIELPEVSIPITFYTTNGTTEKMHIGLSEIDIEKNIYDLDVNSDLVASCENALYYKIVITRSNGGEVLKILTNPTTDWEEVTEEIVSKLKSLQYGNFVITITARVIKDETYKNGIITNNIYINMYDMNEVISIDIKKLVEKDGSNYFINLHGANTSNESKDLLFFATQITIKSTDPSFETKVYSGRINMATGKVVYTEPDGTYIDGRIACAPNTTYYLEMTDVLSKLTKYRFNTNGKDFHNISFENSTTKEFDNSYYISNKGTNSVYYGYTTALVQYDKLFTAELFYIVDGGDVPVAIPDIEANGYKQIFINADYTAAGKIINARVDLYESDVWETSYYIVVDTRISMVALRDFNSGEQRDVVWKFDNKEYNDETVRSDQSAIGILNLSWNELEENEYFDYVYTLYELKKDNSYRRYSLVDGKYVESVNGEFIGLPLTNETNHVIATKEDSKGIYKFEIRVYGKDGKYLGNRIYAFEVQEISTQIYYVRDSEGVAISANSSFTVEELSSLKDTIKTAFPNINSKVSYPLYVTNQNLSVVLTALQVEPTSVIIAQTSNYNFMIYKLSKPGAYDIYLGILKFIEKPNSPLVSSLTIKGMNITTTTSLTLSGNLGDEINLQSGYTTYADVLMNKNILLLDVYYGNDNQYVKTVEYKGSYSIGGNGQYRFVIKDLAGNVHTFDNGMKYLDVYVLRQVVVTINGEAPIENGFYSDKVTLAIYASSKYITGSISVKAEKNGQPYNYKGFNPYIFEDYGTYRVTINAKYDDGEGSTDVPSETIVTFTILNVKEARKSLDLTALKGYEITRVLNTQGQDKTAAFKKMITNNNGDMNISYETVMLYESMAASADKLNVTAGKITFTITYLVKDENYPSRSVDFSFTLNNENPMIECSLGKGESTTKGFTISFNGKIMYEQIGEAYIYINDRIVMTINENSENKEVVVETTYDNNGDGDYYVKIVGTSGVIWDSFKVTIKEPLNFWSIVVILVIVGVVATVVISIVVLRRKMRIR